MKIIMRIFEAKFRLIREGGEIRGGGGGKRGAEGEKTDEDDKKEKEERGGKAEREKLKGGKVRLYSYLKVLPRCKGTYVMAKKC